MSPISLGRWCLREWVKDRACNGLAIAAAAGGPTLSIVVPWGVAVGSAGGRDVAASIWFLSSLLGTISGAVLWRRAAWVWDELGTVGAAAALTGLLGLGAVSHGLIAWTTCTALGTRLELPAFGAALCALHWALIAAFSCRLTGHGGAAVIAAAAIGWWIPSLALDPAASGWSWLFDPGRHLAVGNGPDPAWTASLVDSIPLVAWWVATALLPKRSVFRR